MDTEDTSAATHTSYSSLIQTFNQFLLDQMAVEADAKPQLNPNLRKSDAQDSSLPSTISQLFGMHTHTKTSCPACGHQTIRDSIKHVLDLVYPRKVCLQMPSQGNPNERNSHCRTKRRYLWTSSPFCGLLSLEKA